ncbi:MAG: hypothetical protein WC565_06985 [Parcubacteria group bacterium]
MSMSTHCSDCEGRDLCPKCKSRLLDRLRSAGFVLDRVPRLAGNGARTLYLNNSPILSFVDAKSAQEAKRLLAMYWPMAESGSLTLSE